MFSSIQPNQYVALRLPSDAVKVEQVVPNTLINLGKYGSFPANQIIGRPFHLTFEILDRPESTDDRRLRVVPAAEIHAQAQLEEAEKEGPEDGAAEGLGDDVEPGRACDSRSNVNITDDPSNQKLTMAEIEALKQDETGNGKDIIAKIMRSHSTLDQKTAFSLAKYTLRKHKKYLRQFCVLPLDTTCLTDWMMNERDFGKVMDIRNEMIGLIGCWANVHAVGGQAVSEVASSSRYLLVDDTGGLIVAAIAERLGILHQTESSITDSQSIQADIRTTNEDLEDISTSPQRSRKAHPEDDLMSATSNTITVVHANSQPNLSLLRYFNFDANNPSPSHPLYTRLKTLTWLQLLEPEYDPAYQEPAVISQDVLATLKANKRSRYWQKVRRSHRIRSVVDSTRSGDFDGLVMASYTHAPSILHHMVPLVAGGRQVVVYSPHIEPLTELADLYSTARRTAYLNTPENERVVPSGDFPVDPTLLLTPMVQTAKVRKWQVLPGRTHPLMMGKGGSEGYLFVATRVLPADGKVSARGRAPRRKKLEVVENGQPVGTVEGGVSSKRVKLEASEK